MLTIPDLIRVERVDGTQARLKQIVLIEQEDLPVAGGKGGWDSGEIETAIQADHVHLFVRRWKGWMGLRRD